MRAYVIRRILLVIPTLFIVTVLVFLSVRFIPGDIIDVMAARMTATQSGTIDEEALKRRLGLDKPVYAQYAKWIGDIVLRGTLGRSLYSGSLGSATVEQKLAGRVGVTVELGLLAILTGVIIAVPIGIYSAIRQYTLADYAGRAVAIFGLATPNFWLGLMVMIYPAIWWGWTPPLTHVRFTEDPWANLGMLIIPAVILGTYLAASTMRMTRTMMLEVLRQDYVRTAWAKGLAERTVVLRHAVKNALIPVVTLGGAAVAHHRRRLGHHREHLQSPGARQSDAVCPQRARLPGGLRREPVICLGGGGDQPRHRPDLRAAGSAGAL